MPKLTRIIDGNLAPRPATLVVATAEHEQIGMRLCGDLARHVIVRIYVERAFAFGSSPEGHTREAIGQRGFTQALRAGKQPGMMHASTERFAEHRFLRVVAGERIGEPRMRRAWFLIGLDKLFLR